MSGNGWTTSSARDLNVSSTEAATAIENILSANAAAQKKALFQLSAVLQLQEGSEKLIELNGVANLVTVISTCKGNSLTYAIKALDGLAQHQVGLNALAKFSQVQPALITALQDTLSGGGAPQTVQQSLRVLSSLASALPDGFAKTAAGQLDASMVKALPDLLSMSLEEKAGLDSTIAAVELANKIVINSKEPKLQNEPIAKIAGGLMAHKGFNANIQTLKGSARDAALQAQVDRYLHISQGAMGAEEVQSLLRTEINTLKAQIRDITALATEYRSEVANLNGELKSFKRREPLVQLLWEEIQHLRAGMQQALARGFVQYNTTKDPVTRASGNRFSVDGMTAIDRVDALHGTQGGRATLEDGFGGGYNAPSNALANNPNIMATGGAGGIPAAPDLLGDLSGIPAGPLGIPEAPDLFGDAPAAKKPAGGGGGGGGIPGVPDLGFDLFDEGPQPTKPDVKPLGKMKVLHWTRLLLPKKDGQKESVWQLIEKKAKGPSLKEQELVDLFGAAKPKAGGGKIFDVEQEKSNAVKHQQAKILTDKRFQQLTIVMNRLPKLETIVRAINLLDSKMMNSEQVASLHKAMPTSEELEAVRGTKMDEADMHPPEKLVLALSQITNVSERVECWYFKEKFKEYHDEVSLPLDTLEQSFGTIKASTRLQSSLAAVLSIGNYMNGGNQDKGRADGFELSILRRLKALKDNKAGNMSLMDYIAQTSVASAGEETFSADAMFRECTVIKDAKEYQVTAAVSDAVRFVGTLKTIKNLSSLVASNVGRSDPFAKTMQAFTEDADRQAAKLKHRADFVREQFVSLVQWFNPNLSVAEANKIQSQTLLETLYEFMEDVRQSLEAQRARVKMEADKVVREKVAADLKSKLQNVMKIKLQATGDSGKASFILPGKKT